MDTEDNTDYKHVPLKMFKVIDVLFLESTLMSPRGFNFDDDYGNNYDNVESIENA